MGNTTLTNEIWWKKFVSNLNLVPEFSEEFNKRKSQKNYYALNWKGPNPQLLLKYLASEKKLRFEIYTFAEQELFEKLCAVKEQLEQEIQLTLTKNVTSDRTRLLIYERTDIEDNISDEYVRNLIKWSQETAIKFKRALYKCLHNKTVEPIKYWPSQEEYPLSLNSNDWTRFLNESEIPNHRGCVTMLAQMMELGGESTCKRLADVYGDTFSKYNGYAMNIGRRAKRFFNLPPCMDGDQERYFPIPFQGRPVGNEWYSYRIRPELQEALINIGYREFLHTEVTNMAFDKNTILYGPPGTGKTYNSVNYAVAIIEGKSLGDVQKEAYEDVFERYKEYKKQGRIEFTTFHQSYGYEEFIEGIKPVISDDDDNANVEYEISAGIFKKFCERASVPSNVDVNYNAKVWFVRLKDTTGKSLKEECYSEGCIRFQGSKESPDSWLIGHLYNIRQGDYVVSYLEKSKIVDAIGIVSDDEPFYDVSKKDYCWTRKVDWQVTNTPFDLYDINGSTYLPNFEIAELKRTKVVDLIKLLDENSFVQTREYSRPYVFIIDEINRGNISKIFGELITLIEPSKRLGAGEEMTAVLPNSAKPFGVPDNVYIIGTMNTADRSIATIDTALRRRFYFKEMQPDPDVLKGVYVENLCISDLLARINKRITVLYDREHTIGHSYFMPLKAAPTIDTLAKIFENNIIPLLQEYFYEDYEKIRLVLGDNIKKDEETQFIVAKANDYSALFGDADVGLDDGYSYEINTKALNNIKAYCSI